jgi:hypothetical protein
VKGRFLRERDRVAQSQTTDEVMVGRSVAPTFSPRVTATRSSAVELLLMLARTVQPLLVRFVMV